MNANGGHTYALSTYFKFECQWLSNVLELKLKLKLVMRAIASLWFPILDLNVLWGSGLEWVCFIIFIILYVAKGAEILIFLM